MDHNTAPWLDLSLTIRTTEEWRDIVGFDGYYMVSSEGRVKSERRYIEKQNRWLAEKVRKQSSTAPGFQATLALHMDGVSSTHMVMRLVGEAFLPPLLGEQVYYRKNGIPTDSRVCNIAVSTESGAVNHRFGIGTRSGSYRDGTTVGYIAQRLAKANYGHLDIFEREVLTERECICCRVRLPIEDFYANQRISSGFKKRICKSCDLKKNSGTHNPGKIVAAKELFAHGLKKCGRCHLTRGIEHFGQSFAAATQTKRYAGYCRECDRAAKVDRRQAKKQRQSVA